MRPHALLPPALGVLVLSAAHAASATVAAGVAATCSVQSTQQDKYNAITVTTDATCSAHGLGCVTEACRYCRLSNDDAYGNLIMCSAVPGFVPTADQVFDPMDVIDNGPAFSLLCTTTASEGDAAVGINIVNDVSCVVGGVGCLSDLCRYCKVWSTPQSISFMYCTDVSTNNGDDVFLSAIPAVANDASGLVIGSMDRPVLDQIVVAPSPTTAAPTATTTATPSTTGSTSTDICAAAVSSGDNSVGISGMTDLTCASGGLGCFSTTCRFCKTFDTAQSSYLLACAAIAPAPTTVAPAPTTATPMPTTVAPAPTTVTPAPTTVTPAPMTVTPAPTTVTPAPTTVTPAPTTKKPSPKPSPITVAPAPTTVTPAPTTATPAPTSVTPALTTVAPAPTTATPAPSAIDPCVASVSGGDNNVGISGATDLSCATGGLGCFSTTCRYCKTFDSAQSSYLLACASLAPATSAPTTTTPPPAPTTATPAPTTATPAPTAAPTQDACAASVSSGDQAVGISAYTDTTCKSGGLGCFSTSCRYCKKYDTIQSQQFLPCV